MGKVNKSDLNTVTQKMSPFHYIFMLYLYVHHCKAIQFLQLQKFYLFTSHHIKQYIIMAVINGNSLQIWFKFSPAQLSPKPIQLMQWGMMDGGGLWRVHTKHPNTKDKSEWLIPGMAYCGIFLHAINYTSFCYRLTYKGLKKLADISQITI